MRPGDRVRHVNLGDDWLGTVLVVRPAYVQVRWDREYRPHSMVPTVGWYRPDVLATLRPEAER